ncbi:hypothetical protein FSOLCH5_005930 [Fusarium solani]
MSLLTPGSKRKRMARPALPEQQPSVHVSAACRRLVLAAPAIRLFPRCVRATTAPPPSRRSTVACSKVLSSVLPASHPSGTPRSERRIRRPLGVMIVSASMGA